MDTVDMEITPHVNGDYERRVFGQEWHRRRAKLKELADLRRLVPPSDKETEITVLGMFVWSKEQAAQLAAILEPEDFYCDELRSLLVRLLRQFAGDGTVDEADRKRTNELRIVAGVKKAKAEPDEMVSICEQLRELRRQRRIDLASETIYLHSNKCGWSEVTERELAAVKAIPSVGNGLKAATNGHPKQQRSA